ncbi:hypothetical protein D9613_012155 [Agrocybe pediades]|uniref:C3H1-type domain-containing protein n=1 Tax=Agrocybe pediades TaxID=84607 RepID=A0A8H4R3W6_9AGAR|nr:hypothetical protein D9613_012155 [Agrocybe pediades]
MRGRNKLSSGLWISRACHPRAHAQAPGQLHCHSLLVSGPDSALNLAPVVESLFHLSSTSRDTHLYPDFSFGQFFQETYHVRALSFAQSQFTTSLAVSPLSSPRLLDTKAAEFRPIPRPLSAAATHPHFPSSYPSSSNNSYTTSSLLGLRADILSPDVGYSRVQQLGHRYRLVAETTVSHGTPLRLSHRPKDLYDEEGDPFDPFSSNANGNTNSNPIPSFHSITVSGFDSSRSWSGSPLAGGVDSPFPLSFYPSDSDLDFPNVNSTSYFDEFDANDDPTAGFANSNNYNSNYSMNTMSSSSSNNHNAMDAPTSADGTLTFDVLSSIFGSTIAPSELEDALAANGYDLERAMGWLVNSRAGAAPGGATSSQICQRPRSACHDLERALCHFWLCGTCAKQENCEFLHHLPKVVDMASLDAVLAHANVQPAAADAFPALRYDGANGSGVGGVGRGKKFAAYVNDPSRTRFAVAVKKPAPSPHDQLGDDASANGTAPRNDLGSAADNLYHPSAVGAPQASPRISLRSPLLLPTLPTGGSLSTLYMSLPEPGPAFGLDEESEAWRRGDGVSAKWFSKEGQAMNETMREEMREAAAGLVQERVKVAEGAVRGRDAGWSDDPGDRGTRTHVMGAALGVCLGVVGRTRSRLSSAATSSGSLSFFVPASGTGGGGGTEQTQEERTEAMVDLHAGLHSNEAAEVLEKLLLGLEQEHFYGLAFVIVGEEKEVARGGAAPVRGGRLAMAVKEWLHRWASLGWVTHGMIRMG